MATCWKLLLCGYYGMPSGLDCCAVARVFWLVAMQLLWCLGSEWFSLLLLCSC